MEWQSKLLQNKGTGFPIELRKVEYPKYGYLINQKIIKKNF